MERGLYSIGNSLEDTNPRVMDEENLCYSFPATNKKVNSYNLNMKEGRAPVTIMKHMSADNCSVALETPKCNANDVLCATISQLQKEIKRLNEEKLCKICLDKESDIVFRPCGHFASCNTCAISLKNCPMCRKEIISCFRVYIA